MGRVREEHRTPEVNIVPIEDPTTATPSEIDEEVARLHFEHAKVQNTLLGLRKNRRRLLESDMIASAADLQPRIERARQSITEIEAHVLPLEGEFDRRSGWTRAWLVLNTGGHVHRTMSCRTCFPTTQFAWLTQFAAHDETEIVEQAGEAACTECYPSAPVEVRSRPSRIKTPEQLAREEKKAERAKAKAAKTITAPDGTPLRTRRYGRIDTEFTARRSYCDAMAYSRLLAERDEAFLCDSIAVHHEAARLILAALAAKHGRTEEDLRAELVSGVESRWKHEYSNWR